MSTIASPRPSPRPSLTLSRRTSNSTDTTNRSASATRPPGTGTLRRNRNALRDYYNLQTTAPASTSSAPDLTPKTAAEPNAELDNADFDPQAYITTLLATQSLESVLKVEASLSSEIRSLDGEKKALVYDNYSKLIAATDTIRSMREKMDPMTPTTRTLGEDIGAIAQKAADLSGGLRRAGGEVEGGGKGGQRMTVRWVLDAPRRLGGLVEAGKREEADREWEEVRLLLEKWKGVKGVDEVRSACLEAVESNGTA